MTDGPATSAALDESQSTIRADLWPDFVGQVPAILASQDPRTGRFGTEPFIVNDQNALWPLAIAWATEPAQVRGENPYHHRDDVLAAIIAGGDALIAVQDEAGMFEFRKKDNSTWGPIYMPWVYSRWIRAWALVRDATPADHRAVWDAALTRAVDGIVATALTLPIRNIPAHHAMGVFRAAQVLGRDDWAEAAVDYLHRTVDDQDPAGFWSEHHGPVVRYNVVYIDALGSYYGMSGDPAVLPALERAAAFHANFTYPDATPVETVDERNPYHHDPSGHDLVGPSVGFTASPLGRGFLAWLVEAHRARGHRVAADTIASIIAYGQEGPAAPVPAELDQHRYVLGAGDALTERRSPWFVTLSGYHCQQGPSRWIQDRQAHLSIFHDVVGLVLSGSNTRLQPLWSTFTVGDPTLLRHTPGDEDPDFAAVPGLDHLPTGTRLHPEGVALDLDYAGVRCAVTAEVIDDRTVVVRHRLDSSAPRPVRAHAAFIGEPGTAWQTAHASGTLGEDPIRLTGADCGGWFAHRGWRVELPAEATVQWPVRPHNPYTKDGSATLDQARIVVSLPLGTEPGETRLELGVEG
jgi:hypothetical protein